MFTVRYKPTPFSGVIFFCTSRGLYVTKSQFFFFFLFLVVLRTVITLVLIYNVLNSPIYGMYNCYFAMDIVFGMKFHLEIEMIFKEAIFIAKCIPL